MKRFLPLFIAALFLGFSLMAAVAQGQENTDPYHGLRPTIGPELPNLKNTSTLNKYKDPTCQKFTNEVGISYPVNTGSAQVDAALASIAKKIHDYYVNLNMGGCPEYMPYNTLSTSRTSYRADSPGKNYLSVFFTTNVMEAGAAHDYNDSKEYLFDLRTGRSLELNDIVANPSLNIPKLWYIMANAWCGLGFGELPSYYEIPNNARSCHSGPYPVPKSLTGNGVTFENLGFVFFTPKGMTIRLYFPYSRADGPQEITINKHALLSIGFKSDLWD